MELEKCLMVVYPEIEFIGKLHADPVDKDNPDRRREVQAWFDLREFNGGRDRETGKVIVSFLIYVNGWTHEMCDQLMTLRKGDEVEIKASVIVLGTLKSGSYSEQPYLHTLAHSVHQVGAEQPWPAKIEQPRAVH
jgi:hypothetical protein